MKHPTTGEDLPRYLYEPDENPKKKHRWSEAWAGFRRDKRPGAKVVGKCPAGLTNEVAEEMLNSGVPIFHSRALTSYPNEVYAVHDGVVYRATPTRPGCSYHGFPELPRALQGLSRGAREQIIQLARGLDQEEQVRAWIEGEPEIEEV